MRDIDWTLIKTFLAVAENGSFSAAGRVLAISQPTVGRHIQELERQLGSQVFKREPKGHRVTGAGAQLLDHAKAMNKAAANFTLAAAGQTQTLSGVVRLTASVVVSHYVLPPILARIRRLEPAIELELNPSDETENLLFHEADIAIRMYRPEQLDVVTRQVGALEMGVFAARSYLERNGRPRDVDDLSSHLFVGYDRSELIIREMRKLGVAVDREFFSTRCDNQAVYWELVRAGCGLGAGLVRVAENDPAVERVLRQLAIPALPVWLTAHAMLRTSARIRRVYDILAAGLALATAQSSGPV